MILSSLSFLCGSLNPLRLSRCSERLGGGSQEKGRLPKVWQEQQFHCPPSGEAEFKKRSDDGHHGCIANVQRPDVRSGGSQLQQRFLCIEQQTSRDHVGFVSGHLISNLTDQEPEKHLQYSAPYKDPGILSHLGKILDAPTNNDLD